MTEDTRHENIRTQNETRASFAERVFELMESHHMNASQFAAHVDRHSDLHTLQRNYITMLKKNPDKLPEAKTLLGIAQAFGVSTDYLLGIDEAENAATEQTGLSCVKPIAQDQTAKADAGKLQLSLVPTQIIRDIAAIRMYGNQKYGDPDNWKTVSPQRYRDAFFRHWLAYVDDPKSVDEESGKPHLWHAACNIAFLCEFEREEEEHVERTID